MPEAFTATFGCLASAQTAGSSSKTLGALPRTLMPTWSITSLRPGMLARDAVEVIERARHEDHQRDARLLRGRPEPVGGAVGEEVAVVLVVEGEAHAEHAGLLPPVGHQRAALRILAARAGPSPRSGRDRCARPRAPGRCGRPPTRAARGRCGCTLARSIWKSSVSLTIGYGFCASGARPGGHGRSGVSAAQRCTCESTMSMGSPLAGYRGALSFRSS